MLLFWLSFSVLIALAVCCMTSKSSDKHTELYLPSSNLVNKLEFLVANSVATHLTSVNTNVVLRLLDMLVTVS